MTAKERTGLRRFFCGFNLRLYQQLGCGCSCSLHCCFTGAGACFTFICNASSVAAIHDRKKRSVTASSSCIRQTSRDPALQTHTGCRRCGPAQICWPNGCKLRCLACHCKGKDIIFEVNEINPITLAEDHVLKVK